MQDIKFTKEPISQIEWVKAAELKANDYNPNVVFNAEMNLLKYSLLTTGWIQPILVSKELDIIDGFHRNWLSKNDTDIVEKYQGYNPIIRFDLTVPERMLLTVRINRAKGSHVAIKMHELVSKVIHEFSYSKEQVAEAIGANTQEVDLLLKQNVFKKLDTENHKYSNAWIPK